MILFSSKPKQSKSSIFMAGWLAKGKSPKKDEAATPESKDEKNLTLVKTPKKANMMLDWLNNTKPQHRDMTEAAERQGKRFKPN